ncbi:ABC transporter permease [Rubeoparvulum massiliense]|uniref:ABC transporter permease n=1 Tax=Rubeoparvulum massiliense TaxID=1631346 RepID=UPI00065DF195|nr:ABC transporter permease [Rubeoparvulum massiliense]
MSWQISWRNFMHKKWRTFLTLIAIVMGVAMMMMVLTTVATTQHITDLQLKLFYGNADILVEGRDQLLSEAWEEKIRATAGLTEMVKVLHRQEVIQWSESQEIPWEKRRIRLTGLDQLDGSMSNLHPLAGDLHGEGIIISQKAAALWQVKSGDPIRLQIEGRAVDTRITAIVADTPLLDGGKKRVDDDRGEWRAVVALSTLQAWHGLQGEIQEFRIQLNEGVDQESYLTALRQQLDSEQIHLYPLVLDQRGTNPLDSLYLMFYLVGALALLLSGFILFNALYVTIWERRKEFAVMKTLGLTPAQIGQMVLREVLMLASCGTFIGVILGIWMAGGMQTLLFGAFDANLEYQLQFKWALPVTILLGFIIPLLAAAIPVKKASGVNIIAVLKPGMGEQATPLPWWRLVLGVILLGGGFLHHPIAYLSLLVSLFLLYPYFLQLLQGFLAWWNQKLWGYPGEVANTALKRQITRTSNTAVILSYGVAVLLLVSSLFQMMEEMVDEEVRTTFGGQLQVRMEQPLDDQGLQLIASTSGVKDVTKMWETQVQWEREGTGERRQFKVVGVDPAWLEKNPLYRLQENGDTARQQRTAFQNGEGVLLGSYAFGEWGGAVGEVISFDTPNGEVSLPVLGVVDTLHDNGYVAFYSGPHFSSTLGSAKAYRALVSIDESQSTVAIKKNLFQRLGTDVNRIISVEEQVERAQDTLPGVRGLFQGLLFFTIFIAGIGIVNTLFVNVLERTRELGVMRAIAFTRGQIYRVILAEGFMIGSCGAWLGVGLGLLFINVNRAMLSTSMTIPYSVPLMVLVVAILFSMLVGLLAALLPARRAVKMELHSALRYE